MALQLNKPCFALVNSDDEVVQYPEGEFLEPSMFHLEKMIAAWSPDRVGTRIVKLQLREVDD